MSFLGFTSSATVKKQAIAARNRKKAQKRENAGDA